ncbi:hypothetical protein EMMF5_004135 [Cystobasidiomycetes sp. EMM_F5]
MVPTPLRDRLEAGQLAISLSVRLVSSVEIAQIAATAGWHAILMDLEHGAFSLYEAGQLCVAANAAGVSPIIRVPENTSGWISRSFDAGAQAVIVPHIEGERSATYSHPLLKFSPVAGKTATALVDSKILVFCMIESRQGVSNVEYVNCGPLPCYRVDVLLIGCSDLTLDMDIHQQWDHPELDSAIKRICDAAKKHGKHIGLGALGARPDLLEKFGGYGARGLRAVSNLSFIMGAADMGLILSGAAKAASSLEELNSRITVVGV